MIDELVLLPDHFYIILKLPDGEADFAIRLGRIESHFTRAYLAEVGPEVEQVPWCVEYDAPCGSITYRRESPAL